MSKRIITKAGAGQAATAYSRLGEDGIPLPERVRTTVLRLSNATTAANTEFSTAALSPTKQSENMLEERFRGNAKTPVTRK